jgi:hypothetical protein
MNHEPSRIPTLEATVEGFSEYLEIWVSSANSHNAFVGDETGNVQAETDIETALRSIHYGLGRNVVKPLRQRILDRLQESANTKTLYQNIAVLITDGEVSFLRKGVLSLVLAGAASQINVTKFGDAISALKQTLGLNQCNGPAALFLICHVGSSTSAAKSLSELNNHKEIKRMVFLSEDQLDTSFTSMQNDVDRYAGWASDL